MVSLFAWIFCGLKNRYKQENHFYTTDRYMRECFDKTVKVVAYNFK